MKLESVLEHYRSGGTITNNEYARGHTLFNREQTHEIEIRYSSLGIVSEKYLLNDKWEIYSEKSKVTKLIEKLKKVLNDYDT